MLLSRFLFTFLVCGLTSAWAAGPDKDTPRLPEEANRLKQTFRKEAERALQPLRERYVADLKRLIDQYTRAGRLDDALAVKTEIEAAAYEGTESIAEFERHLVGTKWNWNGGFEFEFRADGTGTAYNMKWKTVHPYTVDYTYSNGNHGTIVFEPSLSRGAITETQANGKKGSLSLVRVKE